MALIKRVDSSEMVRQAVVLDLGDLHRQAEILRQQASDEAEQIRADALTERERIISGVRELAQEAGQKQGYEAGLIEGREAGRAEAVEQHREELDQLIAGWSEALDQFESHRTNLLEHTRQDMLAFVIEIASRVTKKLVELDDTTALRQLEAALVLVIEPSRLVIETHPEDRSITESALPALLAHFANNTNARIVDSQDISRGSCILRTQHGCIDATIEHQIQRIADCLLGCEPHPSADAPPPKPESQAEPESNSDEQEPPIEDRSAA